MSVSCHALHPLQVVVADKEAPDLVQATAADMVECGPFKVCKHLGLSVAMARDSWPELAFHRKGVRQLLLLPLTHVLRWRGPAQPCRLCFADGGRESRILALTHRVRA